MIGPREAFAIVQRRLRALRRAVVTEVEDINRLLYHVLRLGIVISVGLIAFAFLLSLTGGDPLPTSPIPARGLVDELLRSTPGGYLSLGVVVLIVTPVARVLLSLVSFAEERDRPYVIVTAVVLMNLLLGLLLGLG